jgi:large subunit ribosomal protein L25
MAENVILNATSRAGTGKGAARAARRANLVPGIVYGGGSEPTPINLKFNELIKMLKAGGFLSTLLTLKIDGKDERVICRGVQRDVVKDLPIHVDFLRLSAKSRINLMIPVHFLNEDTSVGLKKGGTLVVVRNEVELKVTAGNIPEFLEVDLAEVEIGDTVHMSDITLPEGTRPMITDRDFVIANIAAPKTVDLDSDSEEGEEGEATPEADDGAAEA